MAGGRDTLGQLRVVEVEECVLVNHEPAAANLVLDVRGLVKQRVVVLDETVVAVPLAGEQGVADKHRARRLWVDAVVRHEPVAHDGHAVEHGLLVHHCRRALPRPHRLRITVLEQVFRGVFDPFRLDLGHIARPEPRGFNELGGHEELWRLLAQAGTWEDHEAGAAGALELLRVAVACADVRQKAGQQRLMDGVRVPLAGDLRGHRPTELLGHLAQLAHQVVPLANAHVVQEFALHALAECVAGELVARVVDVVPQLERRQEVRGLVLEAGVRLVGLGLVLQGSLADVLDGHAGDDHGDVVKHAQRIGFNEHACHARVDRDAGEVAPDVGEHWRAAALLVCDRAELVEQQQAVAHRLVVRRLDEGELGDVAQTQRNHLQNHAGEVGAQNFRVRKLRPRLEVLLRVQADRDAVGHAARAARTLVGAGL